MKRILFLIPVLVLISCMNEPDGKVTVVSFKSVESNLNRNNDTVYIINFWSTGNKESVAELHDFDRIRKEYDDEKIKILLISLDKDSDKDSKVVPVLKKMSMKSDVMLLDDPNTKVWRQKVSPLWNGQLPATLIYKGPSAEFYQETLSYAKLKSILDNRLKNNE